MDHWIEIARLSSGGANVKTPKRQLELQVMQILISFAWIEGEARVQGVTVTDEEVEASFEEQKRQSFPKESDYRKFLRTSGQKRGDILQRVRLDLLSNKIRDRVVAPATASVTEASIDAFIAKEGPIEVPEERDLRVVLTKTRAQAQQARGALERGATWKQVARRYSLDGTSKRSGGRLPAQAEGTLDKPLDRAVFRARKGRLVGPVKTRYGYYVFTVTRVKPASVTAGEGAPQARPRASHVGGGASGPHHVRDRLHRDVEGTNGVRARLRLGQGLQQLGRDRGQALAPSSARSSTPASRRRGELELAPRRGG